MASTNGAQVLYYVQSGELIWAITADGRWLPVDASQLSDAIVIHFVTPEQLAVIINGEQNQITIDGNSIDISTSTVNELRQSTSHTPALNPAANQVVGQQGINLGFQLVNRDGEISPPSSGFDTFSDQQNATTGTLFSNITEDSFATLTLTVNINSNGDIYINRFESPAVDLAGLALDASDGQQLTLSLTDIKGKQLLFEVSVENQAWTLADIDWSQLEEGQVIATITAPLYPGEVNNGIDDAIKDTLADISITVDYGSDNVINASEATVTRLFGQVQDVQNGQPVTVELTDEQGHSQSFTTTVSNGQWEIIDADLLAFDSNTLIARATTIDIAGNPAVVETTVALDVAASITINVDTGNDQVINAVEMLATDIYGDVSDIENGQDVVVTVTDQLGATLSFITSVVEQSWQLNNVDLSSLAEGQLIFTATSSDLAGNPAQGQINYLKDSLASITIEFVDDDGVLNQQELAHTQVQGQVANIEDGQAVTVTFSDANGQQSSATTVVVNGSWQLNDVNLSDFDSATLIATASSADIAGNPAQASTDILVDNLAVITINVDTGNDDIINAMEMLATNIFGDVIDIENGQDVVVTVTDQLGATLSFITSVVEQSWQLNNVDLSSLAEGQLTFTASSSDLAGNPAQDQINFIKDSLAEITIEFVDDDGVLNQQELSQATVQGQVNNIEDGQPVTVTFSDASGQQWSTTTNVVNGGWQLSDIDLSAFAADTLIATALSMDIAGNHAQASTQINVDDLAQITINVDSGEDTVLNATEVVATDLYGDVTDIENGQIVTITVTDTSGISLSFSTIVVDQAWPINAVDLSELEDGPLIFNASSTDIAGNTAIAETDVYKETKAFVSINAIDLDQVLSSAEVSIATLAGLVHNIEDGNPVSITVTDSQGNSLSFSSTVRNGTWIVDNADLSTLADGTLQLYVTSSDFEGNIAENTSSVLKDTQASISIEIIDNDGVINASELSKVSARGSVTNVEDGQQVTITFIDSIGNIVTAVSVVVAGQWQIDDVDLTTLVDGALSASALVSDQAGNPTEASTDAEIDTLASIDIFVETGSDVVINQTEVIDTNIYGVVDNIEDGQTVIVIARDINGDELSFTAQVLSGQWQLLGANLAILAEGPIIFTATTADVAGNQANSETEAYKETKANITIAAIDADGVLNSLESEEALLAGFVLNVEDASPVLVTVTDAAGTSLTFESVVVNGIWRVKDADLSSLLDGTLQLFVTTQDFEGNVAEANNTVEKDSSFVEILIRIETGEDNTLNQFETPLSQIYGRTLNIEDGQVVTVLVSDINGQQLSFQTTVTDNRWQLDNLDLSSLADGAITATASVDDIAGNFATSVDIKNKNVVADIDFSERSSDKTLNADSISKAIYFGQTNDVESGQTVNIVFTDSANNSLSFNSIVVLDRWLFTGLDLSSLVDGEINVSVNTIDRYGNVASQTTSLQKDTLATVSIQFDDNDNVLNSDEVSAAALSGEVANVEDGQVVSVTITDGTTELTYTAEVTGGQWQLTDLDLSSLAQGQITASAVVTDLAGNLAQSDTSIEIDTLAQIAVSVDTNQDVVDNILNATEMSQVTLLGTTQDVNNNSQVSITVTDINNISLTFVTTVFGGSWQFDGANLQSLADGALTVTATTTDNAGNTAVATTQIIKDSQAEVFISIGSGDDELINAAELSALVISGSSNFIDVGRQVTVTITDSAGTTISRTATIDNNGNWSLAAEDYLALGFVDGVISATATVSDSAGNSASAVDTATIDSQVSIDIDTGADGFNAALFIYQIQNSLSGSSSGVEQGQDVTLTITDGDQTLVFVSQIDNDGNWSFTNLDTSSLDKLASWDVVVSTADQAGNTTSDAMPTLVQPHPALLFELLLNFQSTTSVSVPFAIDNADVSISLDQARLTSLTSEGQALTVTVDGDGQAFTLTRTDGEIVMQGQLVNDQLQITLLQPLDESSGVSTTTYVQLEALQIDDDGTQEKVLTYAVLTITDTFSYVADDQYCVAEQSITSGSLIANDYTIEGPLTVTKITIDNVDYQVNAAGPTVVNTAYGQLSVSANGVWQFVAAGNLDNNLTQQLNFVYHAVDIDGTPGSANVSIDIVDGDAGSMATATTQTEEAIIGNAVSQTKTFVIEAGSDTVIADSVEFGTLTPFNLANMQLTSNGLLIKYSLSADGKTLTASTSSPELTIFTIDLSAVNNGDDVNVSAILNLFRPLDHNLDDVINLALTIVAEDLDGTAINKGLLNWQIADGDNASISNITSVSFDENNVSATPLSQTGNFDLFVGSDAISDVRIASVDEQPQLTAANQTIIYHLSADGLTLTAHTGDVGDPVFVLSLSNSWSSETNSLNQDYTFTLYKAFDQTDTESFDFAMVATDKDGDMSQANITVTVQDADAANIDDISLTVSEDPSVNAFDDSDSGQFNVSASKDPIVNVLFNLIDGDEVQNSLGATLTHNASKLYWSISDTGATAEAKTADGLVIFSLSLPSTIHIDAESSANIDISFDLHHPIDHLNSANLLDTLNVGVSVIDSDNTAATGNVAINIYDGQNPSLPDALTLNLIESGLLTSTPISTTQILETLAGSDDIATIELTPGFSLGTFYSAGHLISLNTTANDNGWYVAKRDGDNQKVFQIKFDSNGKVEFKQFLPLDHSYGDNGENLLNIDFSVTAIDADGDPSNNQTVTVKITDSVPQDTSRELSFTEASNESYSIELFSAFEQGADGATVTQIDYPGGPYFPGDVIDLMTDANPDAVKYGELVVNSDGTATVSTFIFEYAAPSFSEDIVITFTDADGDVATSTLSLTARDAEGSIKIFTTEFVEDTTATVAIQASPGDLDDGELITSIVFNTAALQGGVLALDGIELPKDGSGNYILQGNDLLIDIEGVAIPNGDLTYTPAEDASNATVSASFDVTVNIVGKGGIDTSVAINIESVADTPQWDGDSVFNYEMLEDAAAIGLNLGASSKDQNGVDPQGSETLSYIIDNISDGLNLVAFGITLTSGTSISQVQLDAIQLHIDDNLAGEFSFTIQAKTQESDNADTALSTVETVSIIVTPVADTPSVSARDIRSQEDQPIAIQDIVSGELSDTSGSESLSFEFTLPVGWSIQAPSAIDLGSGVWTVSADDVDANNAWLIPLNDASSANLGTFNLSVRSFATESSQDGVAPDNTPAHPNPAYSDSEQLTIQLSGVANDAPSIVDNQGNWSIDSTSNTISNLAQFDEDQDIALDFTIVSSDIDGSESLDLRLSGVPDGVIFVNSNGMEVQLDVVGFNSGQPIYAVSAAQLSTLSLRPVADFSGTVSLTILAQSTELDGDSSDYQMTLNIDITPVIDADSQSLTTLVNGREDQAIILDLSPSMLADMDSSETVVGIIIPAQINGLILLLDGAPVDIGPQGIDLANLTDTTSPTLDALINSGRLAVLPPEDADGMFNLAIQYQVQDTSNSGEVVTEFVSSQVSINVDAVVDLATNLQREQRVLTSADGSPIDLTQQVTFNEQDIDGSEVLDYVVIIVPDSDGWYVEHPNGAINDGDGRWIIPLSNLTNDSTQEWGLSILDGATISSASATGLEKITIEARVLDRDDADIISTDFYVQFDQGSGASDASNVNSLQLSTVDAIEDNTIDFAGHLNANITNDSNDIVSFKVLASDLPQGGYFSGSDVIAVYDSSGMNVVEYVFTSQSLASLKLHNISDDYAGDLTIPITIIATDPISGDTQTDTSQNLDINISPVVDGAELTIANDTMLEDQPIPLGISLLFADADSSPASGGQEQLLIGDPAQPITLTLLDGGTINDPTGFWVAPAGSSNTWQFKGFTQADLDAALGLVEFVPPTHLSGDFQIQISGTIEDTANIDGSPTTATDTFSTTSTITVLPVVDAANTPGGIATFVGAEDSDIDLSGLSSSNLELIDQDGSEVIYLTIQGVPQGAVLYYQDGGNLVQLPNNGEDGGTFAGKPTFSWSVTEALLASLVLRPPLDFNGDIPLTVQAITQELGTDQFATTTTELIVGVTPVADGAQIIQAPDALYNSVEDDIISIDLNAEILDTSGDELVQLTITITSDQASALVDLDGIAIGDRFASFTYNASDDSYSAQITTNSASLSQFELHPGPLAFGTLNVQMDISSVDAAIVLGVASIDTSDAQTVHFDIEIEPQVDRPIWTQAADVIATDPNNVLLNLGLELKNPAATEAGLLTIFGLPDHLTLSHGDKVGNKWLVNIDDVAALSVNGASDGDNFTLYMEPLATYEGEFALGALKIITVTVDSSATVFSTGNQLLDDGSEFLGEIRDLRVSAIETPPAIQFSQSSDMIYKFTHWITPIKLTPYQFEADYITPINTNIDITNSPLYDANSMLIRSNIELSLSYLEIDTQQDIGLSLPSETHKLKGDNITPIKSIESELLALNAGRGHQNIDSMALASSMAVTINNLPLVSTEIAHLNPIYPLLFADDTPPKGDHITPIKPAADSHSEEHVTSQAASENDTGLSNSHERLEPINNEQMAEAHQLIADSITPPKGDHITPIKPEVDS
uniref:Ig-like domain-containing protein n=1 Tax=Shewanella waksmanii TaxID=213783 RepID=UPI00068887B4